MSIQSALENLEAAKVQIELDSNAIATAKRNITAAEAVLRILRKEDPELVGKPIISIRVKDDVKGKMHRSVVDFGILNDMLTDAVAKSFDDAIMGCIAANEARIAEIEAKYDTYWDRFTQKEQEPSDPYEDCHSRYVCDEQSEYECKRNGYREKQNP